MRFGKVPRWVASKGATRSGTSSGERRASSPSRSITNGHIEVDGDTARARWYLFMPCAVAAGNQAMWRAGIDHETYARVAGIWMFRHKRSEPLMSVPFETGWATARSRDRRARGLVLE